MLDLLKELASDEKDRCSHYQQYAGASSDNALQHWLPGVRHRLPPNAVIVH